MERHGKHNYQMKVLVVGGLGYIGARVVKHFSQLGHQVSIGSQSSNKIPLVFSNIKIVNFNLNEVLPFTNQLKDFELIIHAAGMNSIDCEKNPELAYEYNGNLTHRILQSAINQGVKRYIYLSTAHVYDSPLIGNYSELSKPNNTHPYALTHLEGERHILDAHQEKRIQGVVLRISNAFGPPLSPLANCWMLVINDLCLQAIRFKELGIKSDGTQLRNFITLSDVINAIDFFSRASIDKLDNGLFNLGSDFTTSISDVAKTIAHKAERILKIKPPIVLAKTQVSFISPSFSYEIKKLKKIGFILQNKINQEIDDLLLYCKKENNNI